MRVLVVSQYFWPETFRINDIVSELTRRGHEVTVLTGLPNYPDGRIYPDFRRDAKKFRFYAGAEVVRVPLIPRGRGNVRLVMNYVSFLVSGSVIGAWRLRRRDFDVVFIFQLSPVTSAIPGIVISKLRRLPVVMWVLDLWPDTLIALDAVRSPRVLRVIGSMVGWIYRCCDLVLGQSRGFEANIRKLSGDSTRFRYLPGWAEPIFSGPLASVQPAIEAIPYLDGKFNVLFAGNLGESQGLPAVIEAADLLRDRDDIRFLILGDGRMAGWLRNEIERRELGTRVVLLGRYPIERMPAFFRAASALLVTLKPDPAFAVTIPGKVQAYLATGLPILAMLDGAGASVIRESGAGLVSPAGNAAGLADSVRRLAACTADERAAMGANGLRYSVKEFDRDALITRLIGWMSAAAAGTAQSGHEAACAASSRFG